MRGKIAACKEDQVIWIMDESKLVKRLGSFPLPVVVLPLGYTWEARQIVKIRGCRVSRKKEGKIFDLDNGTYIFDVTFGQNMEYKTASAAIFQKPEVLETGYFDSICSRVTAGTPAGAKERINSPSDGESQRAEERMRRWTKRRKKQRQRDFKTVISEPIILSRVGGFIILTLTLGAAESQNPNYSMRREMLNGSVQRAVPWFSP